MNCRAAFEASVTLAQIKLQSPYATTYTKLRQCPPITAKPTIASGCEPVATRLLIDFSANKFEAVFTNR
jgi:hypothetical protein